MHTNAKMIPVFLAGMLIGAAGVTKLFAQNQTPAAYFISETTVRDPDLYKKFLAVEAPNADFGGRQLVRGGRVVPIEGEPAPPPRVAIVAFDSVEAAQRFANAPAHVEALKLYHQASDGRTYIVEGVAR